MVVRRFALPRTASSQVTHRPLHHAAIHRQLPALQLRPYRVRPADAEVLLPGPPDLKLPLREVAFEGDPGSDRVVGGKSELQ